MMQLIGDKKLALRFRNNAVSSRERFLYVFFSVILQFLFLWKIFSVVLMFSPFDTVLSLIFIPHDSWETTGKWDIFVFLSCVAIVILGTDASYHTNRSGDNKEFIERYVCIGFVTSIRLGLISIPVAVLAHVLVDAFTEEGLPYETSIYDFIFYTVFFIAFYWRLNALMKTASH